MTSPELNSNENAGFGTTTGAGHVGDGSAAARTDDVSFARSMGVDQTSDTTEKVKDAAKDAAKEGMANAQDAMSQLQAKATQLTSNLIDRVDVDELTQKLEQQVRDHPTRTLLVAAGAGFLLGRAARK